MTSFFWSVIKRAIHWLGIISLAHVLVHVTDFPIVNVHVDELSSARIIRQHKLCATLSTNVNINLCFWNINNFTIQLLLPLNDKTIMTLFEYYYIVFSLKKNISFCVHATILGSISQKVTSLRLIVNVIVSVISKLLIGWISHLRMILDLRHFVKSTPGMYTIQCTYDWYVSSAWNIASLSSGFGISSLT